MESAHLEIINSVIRCVLLLDLRCNASNVLTQSLLHFAAAQGRVTCAAKMG